jgi:hypothetical protein
LIGQGSKDRLPEIPIPLRLSDGDARIDLQEVLHHIYDLYGYEDFNYSGTPNPPLAPDDAQWAEGLIGSHRLP